MGNNVLQRWWHVYQNYVRKAVLSAENNQSDTRFYWRNELFCTLLIYIIPLSIIAFVPGVYVSFLNEVPVIGITDIFSFLLLIFITFSRSLTLKWRKAIFTAILYVLASVLLYYASETGVGILFLLVITMVTAIVYPVHVIFYTAYLNTFICLLCGFLIYFKVDIPITSSYTMQTWLAISTTLILLNFVSAYCLSLLISSLENYIKGILEEQHRSRLLESVITHTKDAVLITEVEPLSEPGPRILYVNDAFTKMTGYTAEEVIGKTPRILQGPNSDFQELARLSKALKNWEPCEITTINYKKNGEEFWINFTVSPVANESGWYTHWIAIERDVTEQKQKELETQLLSKISVDFAFDNDLIASVNVVCKTINEFGKFDLTEIWLPNIENNRIQMMGSHANSDEAASFYQLSKNFKSFAYGEGLLGKAWKEKSTLIWNDISQHDDFLRKDAAGKAGIHSAFGIPLCFKDDIVGVLLVATQKGQEYLEQYVHLFQQLEQFIGSEINRKKLENDLNDLHQAMPDILCVSDLKGRFLKMNKTGSDLLGYAEDELIYHNFEEFVHPEDRAIFANELKKLSEGETTFSFENRYFAKEGGMVWLSWTCNFAIEEGLIYATARNITEEKKLRQLNKQTREIAKVGGWEYDLKENNLFWSDEVHLLHETDSNHFIPNIEKAIGFYKEEHRLFVSELINKSILEGIYLDYEAIIITTNKKERWIRVIGKPEFVEDKCVKFVGIFQDITDKKLAEVRLKDLSNNLPGVVFQYLIYPDGTDVLMNVSKGAEKIWGFTAEEVEKDINLIWDQVKAVGDYEALKQSIIDAIEKKSDWSILFRASTPDGERRILKGIGTPQFMADGSVLFNSVVLDITKETKNEELLETATKMARIGSWEVDLTGNKAFWSDVVHEIHETDPKSFFPDLESSLQFYREDFLPMIQAHVDTCIKTGKAFDFEAIIVTAKKQERWIRSIGNSEFVDGKCHRIYGSFQNIHEQKMTAIALAGSESQFRTIFEIASLGIAQVDPQNGKILLINSHYETITGYTKDELLNMTFGEFTHPDDKEKDWELFSKAAKGEAEYKNEKRYVKKDGNITWVRLHVAFIRDEDGKPIRTVAICEDITDRKEAELRLKILADHLPGVVFQYVLYPDGKDALLNVSKGAEKIWGYSPEEVEKDIHLVWNQTKAGGDFEAVKEGVQLAVIHNTQWSIRYRTVAPNGDRRMLQGLGTPLFLTDGTVLFNSMILDITEETKNETLLKTATQLARIGSWELDVNSSKLNWSDMVHELHETDPTTFEAKLDLAITFYRADFREMVQREVGECMEKGTPFDFEAVIVTAKHNERWVRAIGNAEMVEGKYQRLFGSFQDIDVLKKSEMKLAESENRFRTILNAEPECIKLMGQDCKVHMMNPAGLDMIEADSENQIVGKDVLGIILPEYREAFAHLNRNVFEGQSGKLVFEIKGLKGTLRWMETHAVPLRNEKGEIISSLSVTRDISEHKKAEEQLQKAFAEKNQILESIGDAFFAVDKNWTVTYWNKEAERVLGRKREDIIGMHLWEIYQDAMETDFYRQYHKAMGTGETVNFEEYYPTLDIWVEVSVYPSKEGLSIYFKDVTQRKNSEEERNSLQNTLENSLNEIYIFDSKTLLFSYVNKGALHNLGYTEEEIIALTPLDLKPEYTASGFEQLVKPLLENKKEKILFFTDHKRKDGSIYPVEVHLQLVRKGNNEVFVAIIMDITERKKAEAEIHKLSAQQTATLNALPAQIALLDLDGNIISVNEAWRNFAINNDARDPNHYVGNNYITISENATGKDKHSGKAIAKGIREILSGNQQEFMLEYSCHSPSEQRWFQVKVAPSKNDILNGVVVMHLNITERKKHEAEQALFSTIVNFSYDAIVSFNLDGTIYSWNIGAEKMLGYTSHEIIGQQIFEIIPPNLTYEETEIIEKIKNGEFVESLETERLKKNGETFFVSITASPIKDTKGNIVGVSKILRDITESKKAKEKLVDNEQKYRLLAQQLHLQNTRLANAQSVAKVGSWETEFPSLNVTWSDETYRIFGIDKESFDPTHDGFLNFIHPLDREKVDAAFRESVLVPNRENHIVEHRIVTPYGEEKVVEEKWRVTFDHKGEPLLAIGSCQDITSRKQIEEEILKLNNSLEDKVKERTLALQEANKELETFSYTVSHDLQSPLRSISGFSKILLEEYSDKLEGEGKEFLTFIDEGARRMSRLINDLLRFAKLGKTEIVKKEVDMNSLVKLIADDVLLATNGSKTKIVFENLKPAFADETLIRQVYFNLIGNAVKYSAKKENPTVVIGMLSINGENVYFVKDNGTGFEMKYADKIFGIFQRLHHHDEFEGTGVGLAIVHSIINRHGGRIWADAEKGVGAAFYFTLGE